MDAPGASGVGLDVVDVEQFAAQLAEPGTQLAQAFTPNERREARTRAATTHGMNEARSLAARWAAKEAVIKAWSCMCFGKPDVIKAEAVNLREIEVYCDAWGRPAIRLHGAIGEALAAYDVLLSLSHDANIAAAVALMTLHDPASVDRLPHVTESWRPIESTHHD